MNPSLIRAELQRVDFSKRPLAKDILASLAELMEAQPRLTKGVDRLHGLGSIYFALQAFFRATGEGPRLVARSGAVFARNQAPNLKVVSVPVSGKPDAAFDKLVVQITRYSAEIDKTLGQLLNVATPGISERLSEVFGTEMTEHGRTVDATANPVQLAVKERARHLVRFRGGRAYYLRERLDGQPAYEAVLDTLRFKECENTGGGTHRAGAWGFVLSLDRQFYVAPHGFMHLIGGAYGHRPRFFHSSYLAGERALCAGDCVVKNGQIVSITNASGHYQPPAETLVYVIEALRQYGVDVSQLRVVAWEKNDSSEYLSDEETFDKRSVPAYEFIHLLRGGSSGASGFALDAFPPLNTFPSAELREVVRYGLSAYRARRHFNQSRESKAAVSLLTKLFEEGKTDTQSNLGGSSKLADALAYLLGMTKSPGNLVPVPLPLKKSSSLYQDLAKELTTMLKTDKLKLVPGRLPFKEPKTAFR